MLIKLRLSSPSGLLRVSGHLGSGQHLNPCIEKKKGVFTDREVPLFLSWLALYAKVP